VRVTAGNIKGQTNCQQAFIKEGGQSSHSKPTPPTFDIVAAAGLPPSKDALQQHFPLPDRSGLFADMLGHVDFSSVSPKLLVSPSGAASRYLTLMGTVLKRAQEQGLLWSLLKLRMFPFAECATSELGPSL
jgi:hypothetical protein